MTDKRLSLCMLHSSWDMLLYVLVIIHGKQSTCTVTTGEESTAGTGLAQVAIESISCIT